MELTKYQHATNGFTVCMKAVHLIFGEIRLSIVFTANRNCMDVAQWLPHPFWKDVREILSLALAALQQVLDPQERPILIQFYAYKLKWRTRQRAQSCFSH